MYGLNNPNIPYPHYTMEDGTVVSPGVGRWMTVSKEYATNPNALFRAWDNVGVGSCLEGGPNGVVQDIPSMDYQENYLKWIYPNYPIIDNATEEKVSKYSKEFNQLTDQPNESDGLAL